MIKKIKRLFWLVWYFFTDEEFLFFHLMKCKACDCLDDCYKLDVRSTEELEDLILHINIYKDLPEVLVEVEYPQYKQVKIKDMVQEYKKGSKKIEDIEDFSNFLVDLETQRALERDIIFDLAKNLTFGFRM